MSDTRIQDRRAIEALRSGVPNRDAVRVLGSSQAEIEQQFRRQLLAELQTAATRAKGLLLRGGFGSGKSHLLEYFQHVALEAGFVASKIVISKETPLHDPVKVFRTAAATAVVPERRGTALAGDRQQCSRLRVRRLRRSCSLGQLRRGGAQRAV